MNSEDFQNELDALLRKYKATLVMDITANDNVDLDVKFDGQGDVLTIFTQDMNDGTTQYDGEEY